MTPARSLRSVALALAAALSHAACGDPGPRPVGTPNPAVVALAARGWISQDTSVSVDPLTGEETVRAYETDLRPDTLASGEVIYRVAEYMPTLASCAADDDPVYCTQVRLGEFTRERLRYPRAALVRGIGGTAVATFVISPEGRVTRTGIERGLGDVLDQEVLRLVGTLPPWRPGFHDGEPVAVRYRLPVTFAVPADPRSPDDARE